MFVTRIYCVTLVCWLTVVIHKRVLYIIHLCHISKAFLPITLSLLEIRAWTFLPSPLLALNQFRTLTPLCFRENVHFTSLASTVMQQKSRGCFR